MVLCKPARFQMMVRGHIQGIIHRFDVDRKNPRVEVEILDMEKEPGDFEGQELWG